MVGYLKEREGVKIPTEIKHIQLYIYTPEIININPQHIDPYSIFILNGEGLIVRCISSLNFAFYVKFD